ncbi:RhoGAP domain-containing protein [Dictyostelium discoideum AX4]|uniref:Rho GTPase-activating protein gacJ n=1 Tax=Dictyostelium discoideum TaxID=44689 RepID=GACJ_DICDI|nr:RhoGAP domain-containing protein [Dictyostelium discoideum AX4]Q54MV3.1 RecName: Full=Rho GTPase-activating protein gacJ; AltName: Full=GTPase activating factor for raC protein J [Dictyostelium discoideum]EAL64658.1 RhoGAP domain-containing protein [Dictyostelium discoideum AX4]|eukprot:XP_638190.1 RhoGAP domain-containing protein [Dictyostelium discoideum AX4]
MEEQQPPSIKKKIVDFLTNFLKKRPSHEDLRRDNILVAPNNVSPAIQPSRYELEGHLNPSSHNRDDSSNNNNNNNNNNNTVEYSRGHSKSHSRSDSKHHNRENSKSDRDNSRSDNIRFGRKDTFKNAWDYLRNIDFTFSKTKYGNTVVHRLKHPQFGLSPEELQSLYPDQPHGIPIVLTKCFEYLSKHLETEGLFRVPGSNREVSLLKFKIEDGDLDFSEVLIPYNICGLISTFFKELPEPLIPFDYYNDAILITKLGSKDKYIIGLRDLVLSLPPANLCMLRKLLEFLLTVEKKNEFNKMTISNISIIFGVTLLKDPDTVDPMKSLNNIQAQSTIIKYMLEYFNDIFKEASVVKAYRKSIVPKEPMDTTSISYLDPAESNGGSPRTSNTPYQQQHQLSSQSMANIKPRPPSRSKMMRETIVLSPRVSGGNNQVYANATMTRPMSRLFFDPEIIPSPPPTTTTTTTTTTNTTTTTTTTNTTPNNTTTVNIQQKPVPPKPNLIPRKLPPNPNYSTYPAPLPPRQPNTIPLAPIPPPKPNSTYKKQITQPPPPRKPTSPSPPIATLKPTSKSDFIPSTNNNLNNNNTTTTTSSLISIPKAKPPPPKRNNVVSPAIEEPINPNLNINSTTTTPTPPLASFKNNGTISSGSKSNPNLQNLLNTNQPLVSSNGPPNKPPPQPFELLKSKPITTTPTIKKGVTFSETPKISNSPPSPSSSSPSPPHNQPIIVNKPIPSKSAPPPVRTTSSPSIVTKKFVPTIPTQTTTASSSSTPTTPKNQHLSKDDSSIPPINTSQTNNNISNSSIPSPKSKSALSLSTPKDSITGKPIKPPSNSDLSISTTPLPPTSSSPTSSSPLQSPKISSPSVLTVSQKIALNEKIAANQAKKNPLSNSGGLKQISPDLIKSNNINK